LNPSNKPSISGAVLLKNPMSSLDWPWPATHHTRNVSSHVANHKHMSSSAPALPRASHANNLALFVT
jgi:hypothetical protein